MGLSTTHPQSAPSAEHGARHTSWFDCQWVIAHILCLQPTAPELTMG